MAGRPAMKEFLNSQITGDSTIRTLSTSSARTASLAPGMWLITSDVDCFVKWGGSTVTASASTGFPLWAKAYMGPFFIDTTSNSYIAGIVSSGTGNLYCIPQDNVSGNGD